MKKLPLCLIALALSGCATSPKDVMEQGERFEYRSAQPARAAATCIARNAGEIGWGVLNSTAQATIIDGIKPGSFEVRYAGMGTTIAVAVVAPVGEHSNISIWVNTAPIGILRGEGTVDQQLARGC